MKPRQGYASLVECVLHMVPPDVSVDPAAVRVVVDEEINACIAGGVPITELVRNQFFARVIARVTDAQK